MVLRAITLVIIIISENRYCGFGYGFLHYSAGAVLRGGGWDIDGDADLFAAYLDVGPSYSGSGVGFRCVFHSVSLCGLAQFLGTSKDFLRGRLRSTTYFVAITQTSFQRTSSTPPFGLSLNASYLVLLKRPLRLAAALDTLGIAVQNCCCMC